MTEADWAAMAADIVARVCGLAGTRFTRRNQVNAEPEPWVNYFIWKAVVRYYNRFGEYPSWMPCYDEYLAGETWEWNDPKCHS